MYVVGLDIGYSNVKVVMGYSAAGKPSRAEVMPSGAGPLTHMPQQIDADEAPAENLVRVKVGERDWAACVEPSRLQAVDRELHKDYTRTQAYMALFHAALLKTGRKTIDHLVTGLPVYQHQDKAVRDQLRQTLSGTHNPVDGTMVKVSEVTVLPQPTGAYLDLLGNYEDVEVLEQGRVLIIDPGFFSVDWVTLEAGEIRNNSSSSSLKAVSVLLERTNQLIAKDHDGRVGTERLEKALRRGDNKVLLFGKRIELAPYLLSAAAQIAPEALTNLRQAMRTDDKNVDVVMIVGGGAKVYQEAVQEIFSKSQVVVPDTPVLSNARGFWEYGA